MKTVVTKKILKNGKFEFTVVSENVVIDTRTTKNDYCVCFIGQREINEQIRELETFIGYSVNKTAIEQSKDSIAKLSTMKQEQMKKIVIGYSKSKTGRPNLRGNYYVLVETVTI